MYKHTLVVLVVHIICIVNGVFGWLIRTCVRCNETDKMNLRQKEKEVLNQIFGTRMYDPRIRPSGLNGTDGPAVVRANILYRSFSVMDDVRMEYRVQVTFRAQWVDERLKFNHFGGRLKYLTLTEIRSIWIPDLFFSNEKEGHFHYLLTPNLYVRIFPNGTVLYSERLSLTLSCPMNLKLYPFDEPVCSLRIASYAWTTDDLIILWNDVHPIQVFRNMELPAGFTLEKYLASYCNAKTNTGEFSCIMVSILFKRHFIYHLLQVYIPCCMLVIVSWVSFWLDEGGVATLFPMIILVSEVNASLLPSPYVKAIDVWMWICVTFVFGALLEFAFVNYASRADKHEENMTKLGKDCVLKQVVSVDGSSDLIDRDSNEQTGSVAMVLTVCTDKQAENMNKQRKECALEHVASVGASSNLTDTDGNEQIEIVTMEPSGDSSNSEKVCRCKNRVQPDPSNWSRSLSAKFPTGSKRIDVISRIMFPLLFALFNVTYWSTYLISEEI